MKLIPLLAAFFAVAITSHAAMVGINFATGRSGADLSVPAATTFGIVPQANWNNVTGNTGSVTAGTLVDDVNLATPITLSFTSTNSWSTSAGALTGEAQLLNGYLDNTTAATPTTLNLAGIPYAAYDIYIYVGSDTNNRTGHATLNGLSLYFTTTASPFDGTYTQSTATTLAGATAAEYVKFSSLTGATQAISVVRDGGNVGVYAVQIVQVPEPAAASALLCGTLGLIAFRRRR